MSEIFDEDIEDMLEGLFVTPGEIKERQDELNRAVTSLDYDIANNPDCLDAQFKAEWEKFKVDFSAYLEEYSGYFDRFWGSAMDVADKWATQITKWQARFATACNKNASGGPLTIDPMNEYSKYIKWGLGIGIGAVVIFGAYKIYKVIR